ncbi:MAG: tyrosine--tRNA ligase [Phycisphaerae bacterium]|nr:tyrosine--tRNA ligase [Phycisphaerae bacterium]MDW8262920.1 tyrosine--tRNA ligase [Phycisphaerales bacterium]
MVPEVEQQLSQLMRRVERLITPEELQEKLTRSRQTGKPLRIKLGMDPTAPDVHLGHAVPLKIIRQFQDWGHKAVLIIGDYTARVGDPSGRNTTRPVLSGEQIDANARTYVAQIGRILRTEAEFLEIRYNGEWLSRMSMIEIIELLSRKSVAQLLQREDFARRYAEQVDIRLHELVYPLLQGWDSVMIDADVEMGGSDQLFNNLVGRELQKDLGKPGQCVIVTPLLVGTDGVKKMSKSQGNYIGVTDPPSGPSGMFGRIMSLPDALLESYYTLLTDVPEAEFRQSIARNPRDAKVALARNLITWLHGADAAESAVREFQQVIVNKGIPDEMPELKVGPGPHRLPVLLVQAGFCSSNSEGIRKIREGAVRLDGQKVPPDAFNQEFRFDTARVLQLGNRRFVRVH